MSISWTLRSINLFFRSRKLAVILLATIIFISILGTFIPQSSQVSAGYISVWNEAHPPVEIINEYLDLNNIYGTWLFLTILALLAVNTFFCTFPRIRQSFNRVYGRVVFNDAGGIRSLKNHTSFTTKKPIPKVRSDLIDILSKKGYKIISEGNLIFAEKNRYGSLASPIFHISLLMIIILTFYGGATQMHGVAQIIEGQDFTETHDNYQYVNEGVLFGEDHQHFTLYLEKFHPSYEIGGKWMGFAADVSLEQNGEIVKKETVYVNHPLRHKGLSINKNQYGFAPLFILRSNNSMSGSYIIASYTDNHQYTASFDIADTGLQADIVLYPDAVMENDIISVSDYPNDPVIDLDITQDGETLYAGLVRLNESIELESGLNEISLEFADLKYWASFHIQKDVSIPILFAAFFVCLLSLTAALFYIPRRIWIAIENDGTNNVVQMGGKVDKYIFSFKKEFSDIYEELEN